MKVILIFVFSFLLSSAYSYHLKFDSINIYGDYRFCLDTKCALINLNRLTLVYDSYFFSTYIKTIGIYSISQTNYCSVNPNEGDFLGLLINHKYIYINTAQHKTHGIINTTEWIYGYMETIVHESYHVLDNDECNTVNRTRNLLQSIIPYQTWQPELISDSDLID